MRATEAERDAETLRRAKGDIGTHFAGRAQKDECHQVGGDGDDAAARLDGGDRAAEVPDLAVIIRILEQRTEDLLQGRVVGRPEDQFEVKEGGAGGDDVDGLREAGGIDEETV